MQSETMPENTGKTYLASMNIFSRKAQTAERYFQISIMGRIIRIGWGKKTKKMIERYGLFVNPVIIISYS